MSLVVETQEPKLCTCQKVPDLALGFELIFHFSSVHFI
jgi:hypothetical protein